VIARGLRVSTLFGATLREAPTEVDIASHRLLLRAGYVRQLAAGIFSYLPLAQRSIHKIDTILREEMDRIGGQEVNMPVVHPAEIWQASGRWYEIDDTMARFRDRRGRDMVLAMTHEEVVAQLASTEVRSYRQLPMLVYHLQTKFRDEPRARGGLIRVREFVMKDSYSLDRDPEGLAVQYDAHYEAYLRIGARCGLALVPVQSDVGMMGGQLAHEFMYVAPIGEDSLVLCPECGYAANRDVAEFEKVPASEEAAADLERVHTPGTKTIAELADLLEVEPSRTGKIVFYIGTFAEDESERGPPGARSAAGPEETAQRGSEELIVAIVRGDMEANPVRIQNLAKAIELRPARDDEIEAAGMVPGYASPIGIDREGAIVIVDDLVTRSPNLVLGANEVDYHVLNTNYGRDYEADVVGPVAAAYEGAPCQTCGTPLDLVRGVEVGNIFQLGTRYSETLGAFYTDENDEEQPIVLGSYGIGVGRLLACVAEEYRDEDGLALPVSVAPFQVSLVSLAREEETAAVADRLFETLQEAGVEVLYDDRDDASPGVKLTESDLRGLPIRVLVSERSLKSGGVELKRRQAEDGRIVAVEALIETVQGEISALEAELAGLLDRVVVPRPS
jgi:prolyl-tRNA synthetase